MYREGLLLRFQTNLRSGLSGARSRDGKASREGEREARVEPASPRSADGMFIADGECVDRPLVLPGAERMEAGDIAMTAAVPCLA